MKQIQASLEAAKRVLVQTGFRIVNLKKVVTTLSKWKLDLDLHSRSWPENSEI